MNPAKWKKAAKTVKVEDLRERWEEYRETHSPSLMVFGKPVSGDQLALALIPDKEMSDLTKALEQGYCPIGSLGVPNSNHRKTEDLLCLTPFRGFDPVFVEQILSDVAPQFASIVTVKPSDGQTKSWFLDPTLTPYLTEITQNLQRGSMLSLKKYEDQIAGWEKEGKAVRDFGYFERPEGWKKILLADMDVAQEIMDSLEAEGLGIKFDEDNRKPN